MQRLLAALFCLAICPPAHADLIGITTSNACGLLADLHFQPHSGWKHYYDNLYGCSTKTININDNGQILPLKNNIALFIEGTKQKPTTIKILLNIYDRDDATYALTRLYSATETAINRSTEFSPIQETFMNALRIGANATTKVGKATAKIERSNWDNGKGYDVKVTIE